MTGVERVLEGWATAPLMKRKSTKTYSPAEYEEEHQAYLAARYAEIAWLLDALDALDVPDALDALD
eukprot:4816803-Prymnesium_polylepis.1